MITLRVDFGTYGGFRSLPRSDTFFFFYGGTGPGVGLSSSAGRLVWVGGVSATIEWRVNFDGAVKLRSLETVLVGGSMMLSGDVYCDQADLRPCGSRSSVDTV